MKTPPGVAKQTACSSASVPRKVAQRTRPSRSLIAPTSVPSLRKRAKAIAANPETSTADEEPEFGPIESKAVSVPVYQPEWEWLAPEGREKGDLGASVGDVSTAANSPKTPGGESDADLNGR